MSSSALAAGVRHLCGVAAAQRRHDESDEQLLHAFTVDGDDLAFAALVRRHGPMVLSVCRRVLGHQQDAEDAFQATFLVFARRAAGLRKKSSLASFLHGTAYRIALDARRAAARRRKYESQVPKPPSDNLSGELLWREVRTLLDEEIARLPETYRCVFVLCCLEGLSRMEAARRMSLKEGTVSSRLAEARKRLQQRLRRRGVELMALLAATALLTPPTSALPAVLLSATPRVAVSPAVAALAAESSSMLGIGKIKLAAALVLMVSALGGAGVWLGAKPPATVAPSEPPAAKAEDQPRAAAPKREAAKSVDIRGRVVDPDGKPVRDAKLAFLYGSIEKIPERVWATSAADDRFQFAVLRREVEKASAKSPWENAYVLAAAAGYGFALTRLGKAEAGDLTLRLVKDDVPIEGRVLDLQGKPVAGVRVRIDDLSVPDNSDLTAWLAALKTNKKEARAVEGASLTGLGSAPFGVLFPPLTTGADGRFRIKGVGRERLASLRIEGPAIATQSIEAMTRAGETIRRPEEYGERLKGRSVAYHGASFDFVAAPTRPTVGVVRDKDTGKPLAGVIVESKKIANEYKIGFLRTITDKDGCYRLLGLPKGEGNVIAATTNYFSDSSAIETSKELPYLAAVKRVGNPRGIEPITIDFALKRGVWVTGRVTEKTTGKPLAANVDYFCFRENPNAKEIVRLENLYCSRWTCEDGVFRIPALPGPGVIAVRANQDHYVMAIGAELIKRSPDEKQRNLFNTNPYSLCPENYHALVEITPKAGEESMVCNLSLITGRSLKGNVFDLDGKPLAGARVSGLKDMGYWLDAGAEFTVESLQPNKPRVLQFVHEDKKLAGFLLLQGDEIGPLAVRLQPCGTLAGRLVTLQGEPLAGANVTCGAVVNRRGAALDCAALYVQTGKDGRFRIVGLTAGQKYNLGVTKDAYVRHIAGGEPKNLTFEVGKTKDLGDLRVKPFE